MIVEQRVYQIAAGRLPEYIAKYEEMGLEIQKRILGRMIGYFTTEVGDLSTVVHFWGYDSLDDRASRRALLARDEGWQRYLLVCTPLIQKMRNSILVPASFSPIR